MTGEQANGGMVWAYLVHLGTNMWCDRDAPELVDRPYLCAKPHMRCERTVWDDLIKAWNGAGINMAVIDLGEGVEYQSHPELAVRGSWKREWLQEELVKLRDLGIEPIPKLNFSTAHDAWLGKYGRCVSSEAYYRVCCELIAEVFTLFDNPRFFHLGMDEETAEHQRYYSYVAIRQYDLWWHDLHFLLEQVKRRGAQSWIWSDYFWRHPEAFIEKMPKTVLQSNWYYGEAFEDTVDAVKAYVELDKNGFDQIPAGSNWTTPDNFANTVKFCKDHIDPERLKGFLQTVWKPSIESLRADHMAAVDQVAKARAAFESQ
ncbi:MAG: hypothetical protein QG656_296 [Candidatus Hydrogenedentes bacterium]|nr:hypothetical protein [Candidatus Hydrogenedentota bacterium]